MKTSTGWMVVVVKGPVRQHLFSTAPEYSRRAAWQACLDSYCEMWDDSPEGDMSRREGYDRFHRDRASGLLRATKVTISWENLR